jgi:prepilin-type N-terminal cleavage/methylation domain-containing protein
MNGGKLALSQQIGVLKMTRVKSAFTMIEIIVVVIIISIAAMMAIPMISSAGSTQVRSAANMLAADLEYARSISITTGRNFSVVFDKANETYSIKDSDGNIIEHPVRKDEYSVDFDGHDTLGEVVIQEAVFSPGFSQAVTFDYLGSPYSGTGTANPLNGGEIQLKAGNVTIKVTVEAVTGYIAIVK